MTDMSGTTRANATSIKVWDPLVRIAHWPVAAGFPSSMLVLEGGSTLHENVGYAVMALVAIPPTGR